MSIHRAVRNAIAANEDLGPKQSGFTALAEAYAERIDEAIDEGGQEATKALYLGPHLASLMEKNLGMSLSAGGNSGGAKSADESKSAGGPPTPTAGVSQLSAMRQRRGSGT